MQENDTTKTQWEVQLPITNRYRHMFWLRWAAIGGYLFTGGQAPPSQAGIHRRRVGWGSGRSGSSRTVVVSATSVAAMDIVMDWKPSQTSLVCRAPYWDDGPTHASASQTLSSSRSAAPDPPRRQRKRLVPPMQSTHSEVERKAALENDPWTLVVEPTKVVCRGCKDTVQA
ncbi:hypothetical protein DFH09DRAFT_1103372 [Mycena vulgaris]|nr:hypothetical protein DFH09DRAFT_1103372 [Mycena vulgaris]